MAKRHDIAQAAAKARKQKIMLAGAGVLFVALAAIQGPKLWKQINPPAPKEAIAVAVPVTSASATTAASPLSPAAATGDPQAILTAAAVKNGAVAKATRSQLVSFSLFEAKDPFVQQVSDTPASATAAPASTAPATGGTGTPPAGGTTEAPAALPLDYATIVVNKDMEQLKVKDVFPHPSPVFVLKSLKKKSARIAVKGGAFQDSATIELKLGKKLTLVDVATGVRYVLELAYVGTAPETVEPFTAAPATTTAPAK